jgi:hypothetical protein
MATLTDPHLSLVRPVTPRTPGGCEECLILGSEWVHLRRRWCYVDETLV